MWEFASIVGSTKRLEPIPCIRYSFRGSINIVSIVGTHYLTQYYITYSCPRYLTRALAILLTRALAILLVHSSGAGCWAADFVFAGERWMCGESKGGNLCPLPKV